MTRSSLPVAVAAAVSGGLLLAACGGGGGSDSSDPIQPATTAPASAPSATAPAQTQAAGPKAPTFDIPSDITIDFKGFSSSDPKKQGLLQDARYAATAILEAESRVRTSGTPNLQRFFTGVHGAELTDTIIAYGTSGNVATGAYRYYKPQIKEYKEAGTTSVTFCEDQRKAYDKDAKTGKVNVTTPSLGDFRAWTFQMKEGSSGEWQVFRYHWVKGAKSCQVA